MLAGFIPLSLHSRLKRGNLSCTQRPAGLPLTPIKEEEDGVASTPPSAERTRAHTRPPAAPHSLGRVDGAIREILKSPNNRATEARRHNVKHINKSSKSSGAELCDDLANNADDTPACQAAEPALFHYLVNASSRTPAVVQIPNCYTRTARREETHSNDFFFFFFASASPRSVSALLISHTRTKRFSTVS